jgi:hypothetical protein
MNCTICLESIEENVVSENANVKTRCGHHFHSGCLEKWVCNTCPVCRAVLDETKPVVSPYDHSSEDREAILHAVEDELTAMLQEELLLALIQDMLVGAYVFPIYDLGPD